MHISYTSPGHAVISCNGISCDGYCFPLGPANLVFVKTPAGLVGCGFFDMAVFAGKDIAAAKITGIADIEGLLSGTVVQVTPAAEKLGIRTGMDGAEAVRKMCQVS
jgi:uncharacterized protein YunC (DUF1805 family)